LLRVVQKVGPAVMKAVNAHGFNLVANTNKAAGQMIFHVHFHLVPRFEGDRAITVKKYAYGEGEIKKVAESIANFIKQDLSP